MPAKNDEFWMRQAFELARRAEGLTRPNPPVGAVVVARGRMVGAGYHRRAGGPHAEVYALRAAGALARGATLYVTLEPCSTWGRTPPCTAAVIRAGVRRVVFAVADPNPRHAGRGRAILRRAGIAVTSGVCAREGAELIAPFASWILRGRPRVTLKLGMSLDGRIADAAGASRWITGPAARRWVQDLRRRCDAIMVGAGTVLADDPQLTPRPARGRRPWRIIVAGRRPSALARRVFTAEARDRTILVVPARYPTTAARRLEQRGVQVWRFPAPAGRVALKALLRRLGGEGIMHVLCEGGGELAASLVKAGLVDDLVFFISPCLIGGRRASGALMGTGWRMRNKPLLDIMAIETIGADLRIHARLRGARGQNRKAPSMH